VRRLRALPLFLVALIVLGQAAPVLASGAPAADPAHASPAQLGPTVVVVVLDGCPAVPHADAVGATQDENEVTWNAALHTG